MQRLASKSNVDKVPVTVEVSRDGYTDHGRPAPKLELVAMSPTVSTDRIKHTGCTVLCGGFGHHKETDITLSIADGKLVTVLGAILVVGIESNSVIQFLHIVTKLPQRSQHAQQGPPSP